MKKVLTLLFAVFFILACKKDYKPIMQESIKKIQQEGNSIIGVSWNNHFIVYKNKDKFIIYNIEKETSKELFSEDSKMNFKSYSIDFSPDGTPIISSCFEVDKLRQDTLDWGDEMARELKFKRHFTASSLLKGDSALILQYTALFASSTYPVYFLFSFAKPDTVFQLYQQKEIAFSSYDRDSLIDIRIEGHLNEHPYYLNYFNNSTAWGSMNIADLPFVELYWKVSMDENGTIAKTSNHLFMKGLSSVDKEKKYMNIPVTDLSNRNKCEDVFQEIYRRYIMEKRVRDKQEEDRLIERLQENAIPMSKISSDFANKPAAEAKYYKKELIIKATVKDISRFHFYGYRYSISFYSSLLDGDEDYVGYTNDDTFLKLSPPCQVIMKAKLLNGTLRGELTLMDCIVLLAEQKSE